jgi:DNA-binding beta-propeller fold protein YncE
MTRTHPDPIVLRIVNLRLPWLLLVLSSPARGAEMITFDDHILPVFQQACLNCHNPDKAKGGLDLSTFAGTLKGSSGGKIAEPGDASSSLIGVITHAKEPKMPPEGDPLPADKVALVKQWITDGLLENKSSTARKPTKPKFETTLRSDASGKPEGPPPMPEHLLLEPVVVTARGTAIWALAAAPWAPLLAITGQHQVLLHHSETLELIGILPFPEGDPTALAFTPSGRHLLVGGGVPGKSGVTVTFDVTTGERLLSIAREFDSILAADLRPALDIVATGGPSRLLKLWRTDTGEPLKSIKKHTDWITALDISPDGVLLASGDRNGGVWVWESDTGNEFHTLRAHQAGITATVFRPDSNILATASQDGTVRFWEMNNGSEVRKNDAHPGGVTALAFARDGSSVTAGRDRKAKLWKPDFTPARDLAQNLPALPTAACLNAEGTRAFIGDAQGTIRVFNTAEAKPLGEIPANPPAIATRLQQLDANITGLQQSAAPDPAQLEALQAARRKWSAAAINTRALAAAKAAATSAQLAETQFDAFTTASAGLTESAAALNAKRAERRQFAAAFKTPPQPPTLRAEVEATLAALDAVIARQAAAHRKLEEECLGHRRIIEQAAPHFQRDADDARNLRQSYLEALKPPP